MPLLVFVFATVCCAQTPPGDMVPPLVLSAPVNATHTANHAEAYRALGLQGFLFRGIIDGLGRAYCGLSGDWPAFWKGDPRYQEIALAARRLAAEGLGENFIWLPLAPEQAWFTERAYFREGVDTFRYAGAFARAAGMKGLAVDLRDSGNLFDLRWAAYRMDEAGVHLATQKAGEFGRSAAQAASGAYPEIVLIVMSPAALMYSPLWTAFVDGLCAGFAPGGAARMVLVVDSGTPGGDAARAQEIARGLFGHLAPSSFRMIEEGGGISPLVWLTAEDYRAQLAWAQTTARGYLVAEGPWSSLIPVGAEEAMEYAHLHQGGAARVVATAGSGLPPVVLVPAKPGMRRMGMSYLEGNPVYVFGGEEGAALLVPEGIRAPITLRHRATPLRISRISDGVTAWQVPKSGEVMVGPQEACFLTPVDHETWSLSASLRLEWEHAAEEGALRLPVRIECANPVPAPVAGLLHIALPTGLSLGAQPLHAALGPGAAFRAQRHLQGVVRAGERFAISLNWFLDTGATAHRDVTLEVFPRERWRVRMDGPLLPGAGGFSVSSSPDGGRVLVASRAGDYAMVDGGGSLRWRTRFRAQTTVAPVLVVVGTTSRIFVQRAASRVSLLDAEHGAAYKHLELAHDLAGMIALAQKDDPGAAVLALVSGDLIAVDGELVPQWSVRIASAAGEGAALNAGPGRCMLAASSDGSMIGVAQTVGDGMGGSVACVDRSGGILAEARLPRAPAGCGPFFVEEEAARVLVQPLADGALFLLPATGERPEMIVPGTVRRPSAAGALCGSSGEWNRFFIADDAGVRQLDLRGKVLAEVPIGGILGLAATRMAGDAAMVAASGAGLVAFDWKHRLIWRDSRVPGGCVGTVWAGELAGDGRVVCVYAAADGTLRCVEAGPREVPIRAGQGLPLPHAR